MVKTPTTTTIPSLKAGGGGVYPLSRLLGVGGGVFCGACIFYQNEKDGDEEQVRGKCEVEGR